MAQHFEIGQRVQIYRGKYEGFQARILQFTSKQVYLRLPNGREVRIPQKSLEPRESPPPIPREYLPIPHLVVGQHVDVVRGKYEGDRGRVVGLTKCQVYVFLDDGNREVRIDKKSVRDMPEGNQGRSYQGTSSGSTSHAVSRNSGLRTPSPPLTINQRTRSRPSPVSNITLPRRSVNTLERHPRVVTPPPVERYRIVSRQEQRPRPVQVQQRRRHSERRARSVSQASPTTVNLSFDDRTPTRTERSPSLYPFASHRHNDSSTSSPVSSHTRRSSRERIIASLPVTKVGRVSNLAEHVRTCTVCHDDFVRGDTLKTLPCHHGFHLDCIDPWIRDRSSCPTCRRSFMNHLSLH